MTDRKQSNKSQHQVPRFYLDKFASSNGQVWNYEKQTGGVWSASSENTSCENYLYSITADDGRRIHDIDDAITRIEDTAAPLFKPLIEGDELPRHQRQEFASFLALMYVRTNLFRRLFAEVHGNKRMLRNYLIASDDSVFESQMEGFQAATGRISDEEKQKLRVLMLDPSEHVLQVSQEYTLKALECHDSLVPMFYSMKWTILYAPSGICFITSDNPLLQWVHPKYHNSLYGTGGFRNRQAEAILTLSPTHCFVGHWHENLPKLCETDAERVETTNELIAASAERFLYSHVKSESLLALAKRHADSQRVIHMGGGPEKKAEITVVRHAHNNTKL